MNKIPLIIVLVLALASCKPQTDFKEKRKEVIKVHDVVMADQGRVVDKQMELETLLKNLPALTAKNPGVDSIKEKENIIAVRDRLQSAEEAMNTWMHDFEPDVTGKSNEEAIAYFEAEKRKIEKVDSIFKQELKSADAYLSKFKK